MGTRKSEKSKNRQNKIMPSAARTPETADRAVPDIARVLEMGAVASPSAARALEIAVRALPQCRQNEQNLFGFALVPPAHSK